MEHVYKVEGMTCNGCVASVSEKLSKVDGVEEVNIDLTKGEAQITMKNHIPLSTFKSALPDKYSISEKGNHDAKMMVNGIEEKSKLQQLKPLLLIFAYLFAAAFLLNYQDWNTGEAMLDFMGIVLHRF